MKIVDVTTRRYRGKSGSDYSGEVLIVDVATDDGPAGMGFAFGTPGSGDIINAMITNILAPAIKGGDPLLTRDLWTRMYAEAAPPPRRRRLHAQRHRGR